MEGGRIDNAVIARNLVIVITLQLLAVGAGIGVILATPGGAGFSYDSERYLAGAQAILSTGEYRSASGLVSLHWPPGTSLVYAFAARLLGRSPQAIVLGVNCAAYVLAAVALQAFVGVLIRQAPVRAVVFVAVLLNSSWTGLYGKLWSEPFFLPAWIAMMAMLVLALKAGWAKASGGRAYFLQATPCMLAASCLLGIAYTFRYAAIAGLPVVAVTGFVALGPRRAATAAPAMAALFALPIAAAWSLAGVAGSWLPPRQLHSAATALPDVMGHAAAGLGLLLDQLVPVHGAGPWAAVPAILVWVLLPLALVIRTRGAGRHELLNAFISSVAAFYFLFVAAVQAFVDPTTPLDLRLLSPLLPLLVASIALSMDSMAGAAGAFNGRARLLASVGGAILAACLCICAIRSLRAASDRLPWPMAFDAGPTAATGEAR